MTCWSYVIQREKQEIALHKHPKPKKKKKTERIRKCNVREREHESFDELHQTWIYQIRKLWDDKKMEPKSNCMNPRIRAKEWKKVKTPWKKVKETTKQRTIATHRKCSMLEAFRCESETQKTISICSV